ncbi:MAG: ABC transporter substrate-binding protein [Peptostreptococcaceae bacterium]|nr:ABC transporter substrate-binding protein [Peptostreptococcaceae bacterium]
MKRTFKKLAALSMSALLLLTACGKPQEAQNPTDGGGEQKPEAPGIERLVNKEEIIVATEIYDESFDPCMGWGTYADPLFQSKLLKVLNNKMENDLATEYKVSEDGSTWTFKIRDDVKFHDGEKLTAKDVAFTFNNAKELASSVDLTMMEKATAIDDTTVEFKMSMPYSAFLYTAAMLGIVPEHAYGDSASYHKNPIGSGPMRFVQYDEGQQLIMERNDDYYGKKANFKKFVVVLMDPDSAYAAAQAGTVDIAVSNQALIGKDVEGFGKKVIDTYDYRVISFPVNKSGGKTEQGDPMGNDVTSDPAIRKALSIGISRSNIVDNVLAGYGEATVDIFAKFPWGLGEEVRSFKDGDVEAAKKILDEAGWVPGSDGIREKDGVKAEFVLMYGASALERQAIALGFTEEAKALGIKVDPAGLDWSEIEKRSKTDPMVLGGGHYNPMNITRLYDSKYANRSGWANVAGYSDPKTDGYIKKAITSLTEEEANGYWKKVLWDGEFGPSVMGDNVYLPVCFIKQMYFLRDGIDMGADLILPHDHGPAIMLDIVNWDYKA